MDFPDVRRHLIGMVTGLDVEYDVGAGDHPLLGRRLPKRELVGDPGETTTFELLHRARGVLLDLAGNTATRAAAAPWADRVDIVGARPGASVGHDVFDGIDAVLIRPDGYLAWIGVTGSPPDVLVDSLTRWFGEPATG
jgi:bifunctional hydroxylase/dehydrase